jgi:hypothetical protein
MAGAKKLLVMGIDYSPSTPNGKVHPALLSVYPDPVGRQRVVDAIKAVNVGFKGVADDHTDVIYVEPVYVVLSPLDKANSNGKVVIDGEGFDPFVYSDEPHHFQLSDAHYHTILNAIVAEHFFVNPLNQVGFSFTNFSEPEMAARALGKSYP